MNKFTLPHLVVPGTEKDKHVCGTAAINWKGMSKCAGICVIIKTFFWLLRLLCLRLPIL